MNLTLEDFVEKFGINIFCEVDFDITDASAEISNNEDYLELQFNWKSNGNCTNKYVISDGEMWSSDGVQAVHFYFKNIRGKKKKFDAGIQYNNYEDPEFDMNSKFEYLGFHNLKYGIVMYYRRRNMELTKYQTRSS